MPSVEPLLALIVVAVVANLVVMAVLVVSPRVSGGGSTRQPSAASTRSDAHLAAAAVIGGEDADDGGDSAATRAYDRIVRIVGWVFILATTVIVGVSGLWAENQAAILALLALAGLFVLVVHDLLPSRTPGSRQVRRRGLGRRHRGDPARGPDRWRGQPVLLHLPAHRRWGGAGRRPGHHRRPDRHGAGSATSSRSSSARPPGSARRRRPPRSGST